jgi:integrase
MLEAFFKGQTSIAEDLVFPSKAGTVLDQSNLTQYHFLPCLDRAGLRRFRFHDRRHTFGSLLIRDGASPAYAKDQMGHSSIQVTVDTYGRLIPERTSRGSIGWMSKQRRNKMQLPRNLQLEAKRKFRRK